MSATPLQAPRTTLFSAHRIGGKCVVVDKFQQTARSDFKRLKGFPTMAQAQKSARIRQARWLAHAGIRSAPTPMEEDL